MKTQIMLEPGDCTRYEIEIRTDGETVTALVSNLDNQEISFDKSELLTEMIWWRHSIDAIATGNRSAYADTVRMCPPSGSLIDCGMNKFTFVAALAAIYLTIFEG